MTAITALIRRATDRWVASLPTLPQHEQEFAMPTIRYAATINTPGYLPMDENPPIFDTPAEAWSYLKDEYVRSWEDLLDESTHTPGDPTAAELEEQHTNDLRSFEFWVEHARVGYTWMPSPGRLSDDAHDLGFNYSVQLVSQP